MLAVLSIVASAGLRILVDVDLPLKLLKSILRSMSQRLQSGAMHVV
jgi:hypothetical protein